MNKTVASQHK